ncbi:hypothetical protein CPB84DRAFT_1762532 [Gymnopilus junonius]|uniref:Microbial-type PARG catalytic domain-containing protein n=1 Tax=Gymnopilus junonius TaxID=109634 RepID=A0A9P5TTR3_GYMJU|nr:hypothetical protein CPB84DRAFT_1762532 [Gymnopilus junonius]
MINNTTLFRPDSDPSEWSSSAPSADDVRLTSTSETEITVSACSTLVGARNLKELLVTEKEENSKVGVLNFASAKNPGGGFIGGAQAQEESIARSSAIYPALISKTGQPFFKLHRKDPKEGYYSHAMLYIPRVLFFRSDQGDWLPPIEVDIVSSAAVNAGVSQLEAAMKERIARILYLFERNDVRNVVLGSFGTGVFRNRVELVAGIWRELLVGPNARFGRSFDRVVFAVLGSSTYKVFEDTFSTATSRAKTMKEKL